VKSEEVMGVSCSFKAAAIDKLNNLSPTGNIGSYQHMFYTSLSPTGNIVITQHIFFITIPYGEMNYLVEVMITLKHHSVK
jgi:hypothetical protein